MSDKDDKKGPDLDDAMERRLLVPVAFVLYGLMAAAGLLWLHLRDKLELVSDLSLGEHGAGVSLGVGTVAGLLCSGMLFLARRYLRAFRGLEGRLAALFGELREFELVGMSLAVAIGEEFFFRGAMQDAWGLWIGVLLYGILNTGPGLLLWGVLSLGFGLVFGLIVEYGGGLLGATLAHALLNYFYLGRLSQP